MNKTNIDLVRKHEDILTLRDLSPNTTACYISYLRQFLNWAETVLPEKNIRDFSCEDIRSYILYLKESRGLNNRTINCHIAQLKDFYRYVLHKDWDRFEVPFLHYDQYLPNVPSREEVRMLIEATDNIKHKAEIALLYSSGLRVSELCRLHCGDVHLSKNRIYVSRSKNRSDRFAVLSSKAMLILNEYIRREYPGAKPTNWLFPGQKAGTHVSTATIYKVLKDQYAALGWQDKGYNCHSLRHAFGLHLYEDGTDLITIKEAMGHKSLASTEIYLTLGIGTGRSVKSPYDD